MITKSERFRGGLMGLAVGDALGCTVEFMKAGSFEPLTDMKGGGKFDLLKGQWTDDTSMALCLCESLIETGKFDPADQMMRFLQWYREGHLSSNGQCFDIGITVRSALLEFEKSKSPYSGSTGDLARSGNGSLMRLCPIPLTFHNDPALALDFSEKSSRTTHGAKLAVDACRYFAALLIGVLQGASKEELLVSKYTPIPGYWDAHPLAPEIDEIANGSFRAKQPPEICGSGYVVHSLESVLWAFYHTDNFRDGCLKVINLGDDADTTGAIYGQLAGVYYGIEAIPTEWKDAVYFKDLITVMANELCDLSNCQWDSVSTEDLRPPSEEYRAAHGCFMVLEANYQKMLRKLLPGPHAYKKVEEFDTDVEDMTRNYIQNATECPAKETLLKDFQKILESEKAKLSQKLSRNPIKIGIPKKE